MTPDDAVTHWIEIAARDHDTAKLLHEHGKYPESVFFCHQTLEKIIKGYYYSVKRSAPPYIHNLTRLIKEAGIYELLSEEQKDFIDFLSPLNVRSRYLDEEERLLAAMTPERCVEIVKRTEGLYQWILTLLKK